MDLIVQMQVSVVIFLSNSYLRKSSWYKFANEKK